MSKLLPPLHLPPLFPTSTRGRPLISRDDRSQCHLPRASQRSASLMGHLVLVSSGFLSFFLYFRAFFFLLISPKTTKCLKEHIASCRGTWVPHVGLGRVTKLQRHLNKRLPRAAYLTAITCQNSFTTSRPQPRSDD